MRKENIILEKTFSFSIRIVKLYKHLVKNYKEYDLFRQLLRSGTSIGANMEEAQGGYSKKEFLSNI
jgi:four helix bundle protein